MKTGLIIVSFCFFGVFSEVSLAQPAMYEGYICPSLKGNSQNGAMVKDADGKLWRLSIASGSAASLNIVRWHSLTVKKTSDGYTLICQEQVGGQTIRATRTSSQFNNCRFVPESNYSLFGCY